MKYISTVASCRTEELSGDNSLNFYWLSLNQPCFWTDEGGLFMFRYQGSCCCILFVLYLMYVGVFSRDSRVCSGSNRASLHSCVLIWSLSFVVFLSVVHQGVVFVFVVFHLVVSSDVSFPCSGYISIQQWSGRLVRIALPISAHY